MNLENNIISNELVSRQKLHSSLKVEKSDGTVSKVICPFPMVEQSRVME